MTHNSKRYSFNSSRSGLPDNRKGIMKELMILNDKNGLEFNKNKGLKGIMKQIGSGTGPFDEDELFEYMIEDDLDKMFKLSPDENKFRNEVYTNYGNLFYDNVSTFNNRMDMLKNENENKKLTKERVVEELKDIYYKKKHPIADNVRNKKSNKFQYKKELKNMENIQRDPSLKKEK